MSLSRSNPILSSRAFNSSSSASMTYFGVTIKTFLLIGIVIVAAAMTWISTMGPSVPVEIIKLKGQMARFTNVPGFVYGYILGGALAGLLFALVTIGNPRLAWLTAPIYAACEGVCLGSLSALYQRAYGGNVVFVAVAGTFGVCLAALGCFAFRLIRPTEKFRSVVLAGMLGLLFIYVFDIIGGMFGVHFPALHSTGVWGILISLVAVGLASACLICDFGEVDDLVRSGAPKEMEWYSGFGILITLVWLYLEILEFVIKTMASSDD